MFDELPPDQYELYAEYGMAAEKAQSLEVAAGNVALSYLLLFIDTAEITNEQRELIRSVTDDLNRKTLGAVLKNIKQTAKFDPAILETVDAALERRNYLTHKFFRTHNFAICSANGRGAMIDELKDIRRALALAEAMLQGISELLDQMVGRGGLAEKVTARLEAVGKKVDI
jgi:hypothetical protein